METFEQKRKQFVNQWTLIPLTRAINTLIITLKDKDSETAEFLKSVYKANSDYITWID